MSQAGMSNTLGLLKASYSDSLRANDRQYSLIAYPMRFVSFWLTLPFVRLGFSANQVTLTRMLTTLIATGCLATGNTWAVRGASLLVPLQWLLDSVDGNVARLRQQSSWQGYFLDVLADATSHGLLPIGIALGLYIHPDRFLALAGEHNDAKLWLFAGATIFTFLECLAYMLNWRVQATELAVELQMLKARSTRLATSLLGDVDPARGLNSWAASSRRSSSRGARMQTFDFSQRSYYDILLFLFVFFTLFEVTSLFLVLLWVNQMLIFMRGILWTFTSERPQKPSARR